jgi:F-type H+-transporting ATPase subunit b
LKLFTALLVLVPVFLFASEEAKEGTDIVARVINFSIFAGILYYLIADKAKAFFTGRTKEIADKLSSLQSKVEETKELKQQVAQKVKDSENEAKELVELAHKEAELQIAKLQESSKNEIENLVKSYESKKEVLEKKMASEVVSEVVEGLFSNDGLSLSEDELVNIINKKVA